MTPSQSQLDWETAKAMQVWGGDFVRNLGKLFWMADSDNQERIKSAFPDYWKRYTDLATAERNENGPRWFDFGKA